MESTRKFAAVFLDDSVAGGQAEPGAVLLGGEERLEDAREHLRIHSDAGIADGDRYASPGWGCPAFLVSISS